MTPNTRYLRYWKNGSYVYRIWSSDLSRWIPLRAGESPDVTFDRLVDTDRRTHAVRRLVYGHSPTRAAVQRVPLGSHYAGDCIWPVSVTLWDRHTHESVGLRAGSTSFVVRCRRCKPCMTYRSRKWYARSMAECRLADRTWFATFTWRGENPSAPYSDIQKYLKRLRKRIGPLRFMAVQERGDEGGRLHWHMLLHCSSAVRVRDLRHDWPSGFCKFQVATPDKVGYIANYGVQSMLRVHASVRYGGVTPSVEGVPGRAG